MQDMFVLIKALYLLPCVCVLLSTYPIKKIKDNFEIPGNNHGQEWEQRLILLYVYVCYGIFMLNTPKFSSVIHSIKKQKTAPLNYHKSYSRLCMGSKGSLTVSGG